ncbi:aldo/keto reductase [Chryseobacterium rhizosphaerae]|uniref:aldo/keto reductase n=1 Tax=Chryseobacterium rhizosphaerae TaxID=395937 RepID=UPI0006471EFB|nr:aldo/keto reductase [Chryseobacterium rhizosphaerae]MDR6547690.1 aryl-alcohol dehydrogenase-like predicted oxidoreductase [Chryseobacterium rhizosphaerae]GEN69165.1 oxidoreductase ion channel protein IolS [Chryseobacterium rhizosphaerae]
MKDNSFSSVDHTPVFPLSLGGAGIGSCNENIFFQEAISEKQAVETILYALENGINLIDTSPFYGNSEKKIGIALQEYGNRSSLVISTKAGTHPIYKGYSGENFRKSIENSLKLLQTDYLDIVHIHDPSTIEFKNMMENGGMETLLRLKEEKIIRNIGLGVRDHHIHFQFIASGYADAILPYLDYNLLSTKAGPLLETAHKNNISVLLGSALCMGILSGKNPADINIRHYDIEKDVSIEKAIQMYLWCCKNEVNLMALNYQFILNNPAVNTIIIGASSKEEVEKSLHAYKENINPNLMKLFLQQFNLL